MRSWLACALQRGAPGLYEVASVIRQDRHGQQVMARHGIPEIARAIVRRYGRTVMTGPFAGMTYLSRSSGSSFVPKLLGSYECELHPVVESICGRSYDMVIDVGCAEGYYAVGLARRLDGAEVEAFDINPWARRLCRGLARENGVASRVAVRGRCDPGALDRCLQGRRALVLSDCEGYELDLLCPEAAPRLRESDLLVELHDCFRPRLTEALCGRFRASHEIEIIDAVPRDSGRYPQLAMLSAAQAALALSEFRAGETRWAWMSAR